MKQFACADIVPGCGARVRARDVAGIVEQATEHLVGMHGRTAGPELTEAITQLVRPAGILAALGRR